MDISDEKDIENDINQNKSDKDRISDKKISDKVKKEVQKTISDNLLISKGDRILVALSGGADSVCLLSLLTELKDKLSVEVAAAHLNHMIRGVEADSDEAFCAELCTKLNISFYATRKDIPKIAKESGISEELAGRNVRYEFFDELCQKHGYNKIATAHNKNDRAETLLMRMIRGTGIDGLGSIKYKRGNIIRPILDIERKDIEKYCADLSLEYCNDSTNLSSDYTRNRVRNEVLPLLTEKFNPSIVNTLCQLADNAAEDADFINGYAKRLYERIGSPIRHKRPIMLDIKSLKMIEKSIRNRIIIFASKDAAGEDYTLSRTHIEAINDILDSDTGASVDLPEGVKAAVKYGWLEFITIKDQDNFKGEYNYSYDINFEDTKNIDIGNVTASKLDIYSDEDINHSIDLNYQITLTVTEPNIKPKKNQMILDYDMLESKMLNIRNRRIGDKIVLYKDGKSKKLKSYFIDKKIPREKRNNIPLLCVTDNKTQKTEIAAIIGDRVAENYKVKNNTKKGLLITYGTENENR